MIEHRSLFFSRFGFMLGYLFHEDSMKRFRNITNDQLKTLLSELENFLDRFYVFRCEEKYQGLRGKFRAQLDRYEAEKKEKECSAEDDNIISSPKDMFGSDPGSFELFRPLLEKEYAKRLEDLKTKSFSATLLRILDEKHFDHVEIYKRARIDRKLFSKIRSNILYVPSKKTVMALALAMELSLEECELLLKSAGFAFSNSILYDMIIEFCIKKGIYNFDEINTLLYIYEQPLF